MHHAQLIASQYRFQELRRQTRARAERRRTRRAQRATVKGARA